MNLKEAVAFLQKGESTRPATETPAAPPQGRAQPGGEVVSRETYLRELKSAEQRVRAARLDLELARDQANALEAERCSQQSQIELLEKSIAALTGERDWEEQQKVLAQQQKTQIEQNLASLRRELDRVNQENARLSGQVADLGNQLLAASLAAVPATPAPPLPPAAPPVPTPPPVTPPPVAPPPPFPPPPPPAPTPPPPAGPPAPPGPEPWELDPRLPVPLDKREQACRDFVDATGGYVCGKTMAQLKNPDRDFNLNWIRTAGASDTLRYRVEKHLGLQVGGTLPPSYSQRIYPNARAAVNSGYPRGGNTFDFKAFELALQERYQLIIISEEEKAGLNEMRGWVRLAGAQTLFPKPSPDLPDPDPELIRLTVVEEVFTNLNTTKENQIREGATVTFRERLRDRADQISQALGWGSRSELPDKETRLVVTAYAAVQVAQLPTTETDAADQQLRSDLADINTPMGQLSARLDAEYETLDP